MSERLAQRHGGRPRTLRVRRPARRRRARCRPPRRSCVGGGEGGTVFGSGLTQGDGDDNPNGPPQQTYPPASPEYRSSSAMVLLLSVLLPTDCLATGSHSLAALRQPLLLAVPPSRSSPCFSPSLTATPSSPQQPPSFLTAPHNNPTSLSPTLSLTLYYWPQRSLRECLPTNTHSACNTTTQHACTKDVYCRSKLR